MSKGLANQVCYRPEDTKCQAGTLLASRHSYPLALLCASTGDQLFCHRCPNSDSVKVYLFMSVLQVLRPQCLQAVSIHPTSRVQLLRSSQ